MRGTEWVTRQLGVRHTGGRHTGETISHANDRTELLTAEQAPLFFLWHFLFAMCLKLDPRSHFFHSLVADILGRRCLHALLLFISSMIHSLAKSAPDSTSWGQAAQKSVSVWGKQTQHNLRRSLSNMSASFLSRFECELNTDKHVAKKKQEGGDTVDACKFCKSFYFLFQKPEKMSEAYMPLCWWYILSQNTL